MPLTALGRGGAVIENCAIVHQIRAIIAEER